MGFFSLRQWLNRKSSASRRSASSRAARGPQKPAVELLESRLAPATFTWDPHLTGDGIHWAQANNWAGGVAPTGSALTLDDLVFSSTQAANGVRNTINNLTAPPVGWAPGQTQAAFNSIVISDPTGPGVNPFILGGNALTLGSPSSSGSGFVTVNAGAGVPLGTGLGPTILSMNITLGGPSGSNQFFTVNNGANLEITGKVSGTTGSTFTKEGTGTLYLTADNSGFTGEFQVDNNAGIVNMQTATALGSANFGGRRQRYSQAPGSRMSPARIVEPLTLHGSGVSTTRGPCKTWPAPTPGPGTSPWPATWLWGPWPAR